MRIPEPSEDQTRSAHHGDQSVREESLLSEDQKQTDGEREPPDRPIRSGGSERTFEEMLEEQLRMENEKPSKMPGVPPNASKAKRSFLRRGQGLSRYIRGKSTGSFGDKAANSEDEPPPSTEPPVFRGPTGVYRRSSEPKIGKVANVVPRRKTAVLNKNVPQKTLAPAQGHETNFRTERQNSRFEPDRRQITNRGNKPEGKKVLSRTTVKANEVDRSAAIAESSFDAWLKERGEHWRRDQRREHAELGEFELLEKAADEISFSSNSSFTEGLQTSFLHPCQIVTEILISSR